MNTLLVIIELLFGHHSGRRACWQLVRSDGRVICGTRQRVPLRNDWHIRHTVTRFNNGFPMAVQRLRWGASYCIRGLLQMLRSCRRGPQHHHRTKRPRLS